MNIYIFLLSILIIYMCGIRLSFPLIRWSNRYAKCPNELMGLTASWLSWIIIFSILFHEGIVFIFKCILKFMEYIKPYWKKYTEKYEKKWDSSN